MLQFDLDSRNRSQLSRHLSIRSDLSDQHMQVHFHCPPGMHRTASLRRELMECSSSWRLLVVADNHFVEELTRMCVASERYRDELWNRKFEFNYTVKFVCLFNCIPKGMSFTMSKLKLIEIYL